MPNNRAVGKKLWGSLTQLTTPLGPVLAGAVDEGICLLEFADRQWLERPCERLEERLDALLRPGQHPHFITLEEQLGEYFTGRRTAFDLPLVLPGTSFQRRVWTELQRIPYGETRTYRQLAESLGNPKAVRAVGKANGDNRLAILVPCHRLIGSDGWLTGYGGGIWRKERLLRLERGRG